MPSHRLVDPNTSCTIWLATHRVAISNHRILAVNESQVLFRWKDYAHHNMLQEAAQKFFACQGHGALLVLPKGFPRIRYFGWLAQSPTEQTASALSRPSPALSGTKLGKA